MNEQAQSVRGSLLFAILFLLLSVFLVSQLGEQAKFSSKGKLFAQPAFWPGVGVIGMAFFACLNLLATLLSARQLRSPDHNEKENHRSVQRHTAHEQKEQHGKEGPAAGISPATTADVIKGELWEGIKWLRALEYFGWFMLYVYVTPVIGYLAATVLFMFALTARVGFRNRRIMIAAVAAGFAIVLIFKSFLGVKIPGGAVYESLPDSVRSFMIINF